MAPHGWRWLIGLGGSMFAAMAWTPLAAQTPAGTAFSYQGRLTDGGAPASGLYDLRFTLFDAATGTTTIGAPVVADDVTVTSGLFTVMLDFGGTAFSGNARWLEIAVRPGASAGEFTTLASRQMVTPAPHAIFSQSSAASQHSVTSDTATNATNAASADAAPWTGITGKPAGFADDVDNDTLTTLTCATAGHVAKWTGTAWSCAPDVDASGLDWKLTGNPFTGGAARLGTTDFAPLTLIVNNNAVLRISDSGGSPSLIGGHSANTGFVDGATVSGGGSALGPNNVIGVFGTIGGGSGNQAYTQSVVGGGSSNSASGPAATIGGGRSNIASAQDATVAGGDSNSALALAAAIGGGSSNNASAQGAFIGGGTSNVATGITSAILGGLSNTASQLFAVVAGGFDNTASAQGSFAAGSHAKATHIGSFVWADTQNANFNSAQDASFNVRASGGIWLGTTSLADIPGGIFLATSTGAYLTSAGTWSNASDRNLKERFEPIDGARLLDRLAQLPITSWSYKSEPTVRHIGPMAQDFLATFGVGGDDKAITTIDPAGIALATIQELHRRNEAQDAEIKALRATLQDVLRQLQALQSGSPR